MPFIDRDQAGRLLGDRLTEVPISRPGGAGAAAGRCPGRVPGGPGPRRPSRRHRGAQARRPIPARAGHGRYRRGRGTGHGLRDGVRLRRRRATRSGRSRLGSEAELERQVAQYRARRARGSHFPVAPPSWSTTGSPPGRPPGRRAWWPGPTAPPGWWWPPRWRPVRPWPLLGQVADEVVALEQPDPFYAVGQWYLDFQQTSDREVLSLLAAARATWASRPGRRAPTDGAGRPSARRRPPRPRRPPPDRFREVEIELEAVRLPGTVTAAGRGPGHGGVRPRQRIEPPQPSQPVRGRVLNRVGLATLLFDLLTPDEELDRANVFDVTLLGHRLEEVTRWLTTMDEATGLPVGYFGASTGSAAALWAAAEAPGAVERRRLEGRSSRSRPGPASRGGGADPADRGRAGRGRCWP